ncbi:hypothetical protein MASR1M32_06320 [Rhodobacter sp.]
MRAHWAKPVRDTCPKGPMMRPMLILSLLALAACGADGAPIPPSQSAAQPGVSVSGQVKTGIVGT